MRSFVDDISLLAITLAFWDCTCFREVAKGERMVRTSCLELMELGCETEMTSKLRG